MWKRTLTFCALLASLLVPVGAGMGSAAADATLEPNSVQAFNVPHHGPQGGLDLNVPLVDMAARPNGGYWLLGGDGGVFSYGGAPFYGSTGDMRLNQPVVGMAPTSTGDGYWFVASDGGVFAYGDAHFHGSMGHVRLNQPVVGMAAHPSGQGYWLVARDGGVFTFGAARFHGSMGGTRLNQPIVGMAATQDGDGYWLVAEDGGVFTFGSADFHGSLGDRDVGSPVVGITESADGRGYWMADRAGRVYAFNVEHHGGTEGSGHPPVVGIEATTFGSGYWLVRGERLELQPGDRGAAVERLQRRLASLGYWIGPIDGVYGTLTTQAVYAFQKYEGRARDGSMEEGDLRRLHTAEAPRARSDSGDLVEVDKTRQLLFVVDDGRTVWTFNTSTGDNEPYYHDGRRYIADTPSGRWEVYRQVDGWRESHLGRLYRPKYFHRDGLAIHGYTSVPPYAASHGCVRVSMAAIDYLWNAGHLPIGQDVWVYGSV